MLAIRDIFSVRERDSLSSMLHGGFEFANDIDGRDDESTFLFLFLLEEGEVLNDDYTLFALSAWVSPCCQGWFLNVLLSMVKV